MTVKNTGETRTQSQFYDWLSQAEIHISNNGCAGGFVCATRYEESGLLREAIDEVGGHDSEAYDAMNTIKLWADHGECWFGVNNNPAKAMQIMVNSIEHWYFNVLNSGKAES